jgi:5-deoxy-D-glucuronate isomerase
LTAAGLAPPLVRHPEPFATGWTWLVRAGDARWDTGMDFGVLRLAAGERVDLDGPFEQAAALLAGEVVFAWDDGVASAGEAAAARGSLLDDEPTVLHTGPGTRASVRAGSDCELVVVRTANDGQLPPLLFPAGGLLEVEQRGAGRVGDAAHRVVRTVFDDRNRPAANLVLGEVVNFPGRWSSYPPHHHPQPEIYHYRFEAAGGYGHAELGETVLKVRHGDTVRILDELDHPQVAAPGYAMWYLWVIRHLPGARYGTPTFVAEHLWTAAPGARGWEPAPAVPATTAETGEPADRHSNAGRDGELGKVPGTHRRGTDRRAR